MRSARFEAEGESWAYVPIGVRGSAVTVPSGVSMRDLRQCTYKCSAYFGDGNKEPTDLLSLKERWRREQHEKECTRKASAVKGASPCSSSTCTGAEFHRKAEAAVRASSTEDSQPASFVSFARLPER